jgi:hypothetical protein
MAADASPGRSSAATFNPKLEVTLIAPRLPYAKDDLTPSRVSVSWLFSSSNVQEKGANPP